MSSINDIPFSINDEKQVNQNPLEEAEKTEMDSEKVGINGKPEERMANAVAEIETVNVVVRQAIHFINGGIVFSPFDPDTWEKIEEIYTIVTNAVSKVKATKRAASVARSVSSDLCFPFPSPIPSIKWLKIHGKWNASYQLNHKAVVAWKKLGDAIGEMHLATARALIAKHLTKDENAAILCAEKALQAIDTAMQVVPEATHAWEAFYHMIFVEDNPGSTGTQIKQETPQRFYSAVI
jgi:hypothetical protein